MHQSHLEPYDQPGVATIEAGQVLLDGPDGIAIALTAKAAIATGRSLVEAGERLLQQRQS